MFKYRLYCEKTQIIRRIEILQSKRATSEGFLENPFVFESFWVLFRFETSLYFRHERSFPLF